eukprot:m.60422 g.60422  ORF g.60422 m.60422 type:complete len:705 (-) comp7942_c0_seq1:40-2154(-)
MSFFLQLFRSSATRNHAKRVMSTSASPKLLEKVLIANRGEIACRIMRTCHRLGINTVAVYSEADKDSLHVAMADEAYCVGPAPSAESYLRTEAIIDVAKKTGAQGIHPGYGFLSENDEFADQCQDAGITFIGPPSSAIVSMGLKDESKRIMENSGVPVVAGYHGDNQDKEFLKQQGTQIGYPLMIKAVKGGGGKGMRVVHSEKEFFSALEHAQNEALKHFKDDRVLLEKYVQRPRHVEVQVFADKHGNAVHLFERDCSLQRRHQKIIEEAPAFGLDASLREEFGSAAVRAALAVGYVGAGTVEFIMDTVSNKFYFMEMNTRLQVEHPVTEMVTGTDLVEWQLRVASGFPICSQDDITCTGHSFEARIYAENPTQNFLPGSGPLAFLRTPQESDTVRVETGVREGDHVTPFYDPMIAKLVVWDENRDKALSKLLKELENFQVAGLPTNIKFLQACGAHPGFRSGDVTTDFIADHNDNLMNFACNTNVSEKDLVLAAVATAQQFRNDTVTSAANKSDPWTSLKGFRLNVDQTESILLDVEGQDESVEVLITWNDTNSRSMNVTVNGGDNVFSVESIVGVGSAEDKSEFLYRINNCKVGGRLALINFNEANIFSEGNSFSVTLPRASHELGVVVDPNKVAAPMAGIVSKVLVQPGDRVEKDDPVVVMEAMKMELTFKVPRDGVVAAVHVKQHDQVSEGAPLVELEKE